MITEELIKEHNLSDEEYSRILEILGREPNLVELGIFSAMWSYCVQIQDFSATLGEASSRFKQSP